MIGGYEMIRQALVAAGLLSANATEAEFMALLGEVCAQLAASTGATGIRLSQAQIANELVQGSLFTQRVANIIRTTGSINSLSASGRGAVVRMLSQSARVALRGGGRAGFTLLSWPAVIATILIIGAISGGVYMYHNWGKPSQEPIAAGPAMNRSADQIATQSALNATANASSSSGQATVTTGTGPYYIYSLNLSGPNIYIGTQANIQVPACNFTDGGTCSPGDPNVTVLATLGGPYDTNDQAVTAYCGMVTNIHGAFGGTKGDIQGQSYWLDNAPACP